MDGEDTVPPCSPAAAAEAISRSRTLGFRRCEIRPWFSLRSEASGLGRVLVLVIVCRRRYRSLGIERGFQVARQCVGGAAAPVVQEQHPRLLVRHVRVNRHDVDAGSAQRLQHRLCILRLQSGLPRLRRRT